MTWQGIRSPSVGKTKVKCSGMLTALGYVKRCACDGQVADHAIDRAAIELNRSGLQRAISGYSPMFVHKHKILLKL